MGAQGRLILVQGGRPSLAARPVDSIISLTQELIRMPTQGGIDDQVPALEAVRDWLENRGVRVTVLEAPHRKKKNRGIGLLAEVGNKEKGPNYCLTACLDTAPFGGLTAWDGIKPTSGHISPDGWLVGRGSADSKIGVSIFCHIMASLVDVSEKINGRIILLLDSDEHSGRFGAIKELVRREKKIDGVYIGYPGQDSIKIGARGFYRAKIKIYGRAAHSGSRNPSRENAVYKAAKLVSVLDEYSKDMGEKFYEEKFGIGPQLTVTQVSGGRGYSIVPDECFIRVDFRLTNTFNSRSARDILKEFVDDLDSVMPTYRPSRIEHEKSWPAYRLHDESYIVSSLVLSAANILGRKPKLQVSGPSNVGNYLRSEGIDATCGFGVVCKNLHAPGEAVDLSSVEETYLIYLGAIKGLLNI